MQRSEASAEHKESPAIAGEFESLGGGGPHRGDWAFGCEFGFYQRHMGKEPMGLLRWASIAYTDLLLGLNQDFNGVDDINQLEMREHTGWDWGVTQKTYNILMDHTHLRRAEIDASEARVKICAMLGVLKRKLIEDLTDGRKIFVYKTYGYTLSIDQLVALASAVKRYGPGKLLYVQIATSQHPIFVVEDRAYDQENLLIGHIDAFAPQNGKLIYNHNGWQKVCEAALVASGKRAPYIP